MKEIEEAAIKAFSPLKPDKKVIADYDEPEDVLYVNFVNSPPEEAAFGRMFGDYIIRCKKDGLVVGITILHAMEHCEKKFEDKPLALKEPVMIHFV
jgi:uncharacterized protein YuzE